MFEKDLVRCHNTEKADVRFGDGALRHAIGTHCFQIMRATQSKEASSDGYGWSYNHAAMIVYWKGRFFVDYLSGPVSEHVPPSQTLIAWSENGARFSKPVVLFPPMKAPAAPYRGPKKELLENEFVDCVMHQRMSFFVSADHRLLATAFYGISPDDTVAPNNGYGVGRVVREIYEDCTFSDIYFLRLNEAGGYTEENAHMFPEFHKCDDEGFVAACEELLSNRLVTQQMWEEERFNPSMFTYPEGRSPEALSYFTRPDGGVTGLFKNSLTAESFDRGETWGPLEVDYSLETSTGKVWGQRTSDGRYALAYNPTTDSAHRWPIAVVSGENGRDFDQLMAITPEVSPHKYAGLYKNLGPQYIRGIIEDNPQPPDGKLWLAYTVNKEDVWVSCTEVPLRAVTDQELDEDFTDCESSDFVKGWNLYEPLWCPVRVSAAPDGDGRCLVLKDADPYDRCRAMRVFPEKEALEAVVTVMADGQDEATSFTMDIQDRHGSEAVRLYWGNDGMLVVKNGGRYSPFCPYEKGQWMHLTIRANRYTNLFSVRAEQNGRVYEKRFRFSLSVHSLERILFTSKRTLPYNSLEDCGKWGDLGNLEHADQKLKEGTFCIKSVSVREIELGADV